MRPLFASLLLFGSSAPMLHAALNLSVSFTDTANSSLSSSDKQLFSDAVNYWGNYLTGYRDGVSRNWNFEVDVFVQASVDGGILMGYAGPSALSLSGVVSGAQTDNSCFLMSSAGLGSFNIHPDAGPLNLSVLRHEVAHALGFGTLWEDNQIYSDGISGNSNRELTSGIPGQYIGNFGLSAYRAEYDVNASYIPVELDGGPGTEHGHWNQSTDNFMFENVMGFDSDPGDTTFAATVSTAGALFGRSLDDELMTGVLSSDPYLSFTTIQSFQDLGFTVIPELPVSGWLAFPLLLIFRRSRI